MNIISTIPLNCKVRVMDFFKFKYPSRSVPNLVNAGKAYDDYIYLDDTCILKLEMQSHYRGSSGIEFDATVYPLDGSKSEKFSISLSKLVGLSWEPISDDEIKEAKAEVKSRKVKKPLTHTLAYTYITANYDKYYGKLLSTCGKELDLYEFSSIHDKYSMYNNYNHNRSAKVISNLSNSIVKNLKRDEVYTLKGDSRNIATLFITDGIKSKKSTIFLSRYMKYTLYDINLNAIKYVDHGYTIEICKHPVKETSTYEEITKLDLSKLRNGGGWDSHNDKYELEIKDYIEKWVSNNEIIVKYGPNKK